MKYKKLIPDIIIDLYNVAIFLKYIKDPCKKCLVKVTCDPSVLGVSCDPWKNHKRLGNAYGALKDEISDKFFISCLLGGLIFCILTVVFGLWKWGEIIYSYANHIGLIDAIKHLGQT